MREPPRPQSPVAAAAGMSGLALTDRHGGDDDSSDSDDDDDDVTKHHGHGDGKLDF